MALTTPELDELFALFDRDADGGISVKEVTAALRPTSYSIRQVVATVGGDKLSRAQFDELLNLKVTQDPKWGKYRLRFNALDVSGTGKVSASDMKNVAGKLGKAVSDEDVDAWLAKFDNNDGQISFHEYCKRYVGADSADPDEFLRKAWMHFDMYNMSANGYVEAADIAEYYRLTGDEKDVVDILNKIKDIDQDNDNKISFDEFYEFFAQKLVKE